VSSAARELNIASYTIRIILTLLTFTFSFVRLFRRRGPVRTNEEERSPSVWSIWCHA
jgi:hypothetical protein